MPNSLSYADRPDLIRIEGQNIAARFDRLSPTTGRVSWNIPTPAAGAGATSRAYNGFVVTGSTKPADAATAPVNGQTYSADPSLDADTHAGGKLGHALVVAARYNDTSTDFVDVSDLDPTRPYYFAVYAVDSQLNYYRAGAHTYSATLNVETKESLGLPAWHAVEFSNLDFINGGDAPTNLNPTQNYSFMIEVDCKEHRIVLPGAAIQSYGELMKAINAELDKIGSPHIGAQAPGTGGVFILDDVGYLWDGATSAPLQYFIRSATDPTIPADGKYFYDSLNKILHRGDGTQWINTPFVTATMRPDKPECGMHLFNGTTVFRWDGSGWCAVQTFVQTTNPFLPQIDACQQYWYDSARSGLNRMESNGKWKSASAIYTPHDPNALPDGLYWYNPTGRKLNRRINGEWSITHVVTSKTRPAPAAGLAWYNPQTQELQVRNLLDTEWEEQTVVTYNADPSVRVACDVWWNATTDELHEWDSLNQRWALIENFIIADYDPSAGVVVDPDAVWFNPETGELRTWEGLCEAVSVLIYYGGDPRDMGDGTIWYNPLTKKFMIKSGDTWNDLDVIQFGGPPTDLPLRTFWYDGTSLFMWNGMSWMEVMFSRSSLVPENGATWFNTTESQLYKWNGSRWEKTGGKATAVVYNHDRSMCWTCPSNAPIKDWKKTGIYFITEKTGSDQCIRVKDGNLFASLGGIVNQHHVEGSDGVDPRPLYMQDDVGTSGSETERKILTRDIELALGGSGLDLELSREDLDHSIDRAIRTLRQRAAPYTRGYFPVAGQRGKKRFLLTNKKLGHDKIVRVLGVYRGNGMWPVPIDGGINSYINPLMMGAGGQPGGGMAMHFLQAAHIEEMETLLARRVTYFFNERSRVLEIHNNIALHENLLIEAAVEMTEQDIMMDRRYRNWIERWAVAESQMKLAEIRGKFQTIPGPNGGIVMNSSELRSSATETMTALLAEIEQYIVGDLSDFTGALMAIG